MNSVWMLVREHSKPYFKRILRGVLFSGLAALMISVVLQTMAKRPAGANLASDLSRAAPGIVSMMLGLLTFCLSLAQTEQWCGLPGMRDQVRSSAIQDRHLHLAMSLQIWLNGILHFLLLSGILFSILKIRMTFLSFAGYGLFVLVGSYVFLQLGILVGLFVSHPEQKFHLGILFLMPLFLISGVFDPVYQLPGVLRQLITILPTTAMVEGAREILILSHLNWWYLLYLILWAVFTQLMSYFFFRRRLNP